MYKITVKGEAKTDYSNPQELDGIDCQDEFTEYFGEDEQNLIDKGVKSGYMDFKFKDGKLWTVTTYSCNNKLTDIELEELKEYTTGQWSDGIGEGFEQNSCFEDEDGEEVFISPWFHGQVVSITQEELVEA